MQKYWSEESHIPRQQRAAQGERLKQLETSLQPLEAAYKASKEALTTLGEDEVKTCEHPSLEEFSDVDCSVVRSARHFTLLSPSWSTSFYELKVSRQPANSLVFESGFAHSIISFFLLSSHCLALDWTFHKWSHVSVLSRFSKGIIALMTVLRLLYVVQNHRTARGLKSPMQRTAIASGLTARFYHPCSQIGPEWCIACWWIYSASVCVEDYVLVCDTVW